MASPIEIKQEPSALERRADELRDRLVHTIDMIEKRAHEVTNVRLQLGRHAGLVRTLSSVGIALFASGVAYEIYRFRTRHQRHRRQRLRALARIWRHPDRIAAAEERGFFPELFRRVALGSITFFAIEMAKRSMRHAVPELHEEERIPRLLP
jgi:hypothetical protein